MGATIAGDRVLIYTPSQEADLDDLYLTNLEAPAPCGVRRAGD